jgi:hypothetical protein
MSNSISGNTSCFIEEAIINPPKMNIIIRRFAATWLWAIHFIGPFIDSLSPLFLM